MLRRLLPCFLAFLLLVPTLTSQSLWWDEGISLHLAGLSWQEIVADRAANIHPPLYFLILSAWTHLVGRTAFAGRYLSALVTALLPALVYRFLGRRLGRRAGRVGALLVALAPPFLVYGQETRAYALLLPWVLALWSLVWRPRGEREDGRRATLGRGILLGVVQVGIVLSHYQGVVAVAIASIWLLAQGLWGDRTRARRGALTQWVIGAVVSLVLVLPWLFVMGRVGLEGLRGQAGLDNPSSHMPPVGYILNLVGIFHTTGLPEALADPALVRSSMLAGAMLGAALLLTFIQPRARRAATPVMALWLLPLLSVPLIWAMSPQSHPRYIFPFVVGGWLLAAILVEVGLRQGRSATGVGRRIGGGGLLAALLVTSILGSRAYLTDPMYARADIRGVAAYVAAHAEAGDIVIVPNTDWSLAQYDVGAARLVMETRDGDVGSMLTDGVPPRRIYALDYARGALDQGGVLRAWLTWNGMLVERHPFHGALLEVYELHDTASLPECTPIPRQCVAGTRLCLMGVAYQEAPVSGAAMPVRLCWDGAGATDRYGVAFRLYAPNEAVVVAHDELLVDDRGRVAETWSGPGATSYHVVPLLVGLLPQAYRLEVGVYSLAAPGAAINLVDAAGIPRSAWPLGAVEPLAMPWRDASLYGVAAHTVVPQSLITPFLAIDGVAVDRARVAPGQSVFINVVGRTRASGAAEGDLIVGLRRNGEWIVTQTADPLPLDIPVDRPVSLSLALAVPATAERGAAEVILRAGNDEAVVGHIMVDGTGHRYDVPPVAHLVEANVDEVATLVGFDLTPAPVLRAGAPCTLTLVWRAASGLSASAWAASDLKIFAHLVVGETIVAQHDAVPANWTRPTMGWVPDEIVVDDHELTWQRSDVAGAAFLRVGLYDGATGKRVPWGGGLDAWVLPLDLTVETAPWR